MGSSSPTYKEPVGAGTPDSELVGGVVLLGWLVVGGELVVFAPDAEVDAADDAIMVFYFVVWVRQNLKNISAGILVPIQSRPVASVMPTSIAVYVTNV